MLKNFFSVKIILRILWDKKANRFMNIAYKKIGVIY